MSQSLRSQHTAPGSATSGSQTISQTSSDNPDTPSATLRLRGTRESSSRRIQWAEDVVDNEGMGKKSSKVCCIYHKPHEPGDSDTEDSSSSSDSDDEPDLSRAQRVGDSKKSRGQGDGAGAGKGKQRRPSPNAYERQPKPKAAPYG